MATVHGNAPQSPPGPSPLAESRRLFRDAERFEGAHEADRQLDGLKRYLAHVEEHRPELEEGAPEVAHDLARVAMTFHHHSENELALRAVDVGLSLVPGSAELLHHKALILLALNRQVDQAVLLLDRSLEANPHDKRAWATKGDVLKLLGRTPEAVEAYLSAQRLDAASSQYVDRALKLDPQNLVALRMKLQLARSGGGEQQALEAAEALLTANPTDSELLLEKARLLATLGQLQSALDTLTPVAAERPDDPHVRFLKARLLFAMGRLDEAVPIYTELIRQKQLADSVALTEIAGDLEKNGHQPELLLDSRQRLRELDPHNLANLQSLRATAVALNRNELAIDAARAILEASPKSLDALRSLIELELAAGALDEAVATGQELLREHPTEVVDLRRILHAAQSGSRPDRVKEFAEAILKVEPEDTETQAALGAALVQSGEREQALAIYDRLSAKEPTETRYLLERKRLLVDLNRAPDLVPVLDALFRLDPSRYDVALERGNLYLGAAYELGEGTADREAAAREAMVSYERATVDPTLQSAARLGMARASALVHDAQRAVKAYREFLGDPEFSQRADISKELGDVLRAMDRQTEAREAYERAAALGLDDNDLYWGLVETLSRLNEETRALRYIDLLLQRAPSNPMYLRRKGQLLLKAGRRAEGLAVLKGAIQASRGDAHAYFEIAEALRAQGTYGDSIAYFEQGLREDPHSRTGRLGLAETYQVAGRFSEALPLADRLLHEEPNDLRAWKIRAEVHRALGHDAEVIYSLKAILLLDPHNIGALTEKYELQAKRGLTADAYETLSELLAAGGPEAENPALWIDHGDLAATLGKSEESNASYEKAQHIDPARGLEVITRRARVRLQAGRPDLALEILDSTPVPDPAGQRERAIPYLLLRAQVLGTLERPGDAQATYEAIRKADPASLEATDGLARSLLDSGKPEEARTFLREVMPTQTPRAELFLLLAEAEAAIGSLPFATEVIRRGVESIPRSLPLWMRLGELQVRQESWDKAADAYAHAIALSRSDPELLLRAGFVAEKLGHSHEALTLYARATELAPANKYAWSSHGLALLSLGKPDEARTSFDRALALDSDFEAAKDGRKAANQRTRDATIEKYGREALLLEARLNRTVTKNDLFVTLHVPFELLDPVLQVLSRFPRIDVDKLPEKELQDLEVASYHLITAALQSRPAGIEHRGLTLADVAVLSPPTYTLGQVQRLFGYLRSVLEMDLRPENLRLAPDVEDLARKALALPAEQRTLFQLVQVLRVGVFKARVIKAVETAGRAVHAPLPALDLAAYAPDAAAPAAASSAARVGHAAAPAPLAEDEIPFSPSGAPGPGPHARPPPPAGGTARCLGCGGIASVLHSCGAPLCQHCASQFPKCPKCGEPITQANSTPLEHAHPRATARETHHHATPSHGSTPTGHSPPPAATHAATKPGAGSEAKPSAEKDEDAPPPASTPAPVRARPKTDDEPRL